MFIFGVNTAFVVKRQIFDLINVFAGQTDFFNGGLPGSLGAGGFSLGGNQRLAVAFFYPVRIIFVLILISVFVNRFGRLRPGKSFGKSFGLFGFAVSAQLAIFQIRLVGLKLPVVRFAVPERRHHALIKFAVGFRHFFDIKHFAAGRLRFRIFGTDFAVFD